MSRHPIESKSDHGRTLSVGWRCPHGCQPNHRIVTIDYDHGEYQCEASDFKVLRK